MDVMAAVRHVKAAEPGIGAKKLAARVKKEFPHLSSGSKVGTKEIREALAKLATDTAHRQCDANDKENHAVHNERTAKTPTRPGGVIEPCAVVHETAPENGKQKASDQLATHKAPEEREVLPVTDLGADCWDGPSVAVPPAPDDGGVAPTYLGLPRPITESAQGRVKPLAPAGTPHSGSQQESGPTAMARQYGLAPVVAQPEQAQEQEAEGGDEDAYQQKVGAPGPVLRATRRWQGWDSEVASLRGQQMAPAGSVRKMVELRRLAAQARGSPTTLRYVREQMRLHKIR